MLFVCKRANTQSWVARVKQNKSAHTCEKTTECVFYVPCEYICIFCIYYVYKITVGVFLFLHIFIQPKNVIFRESYLEDRQVLVINLFFAERNQLLGIRKWVI